LPPESEILVSAITIPDMVRIIEYHGLVPIPIDLDVNTMGPNVVNMRRAVSSKTRAIITTHLMGGRSAMEPILQVAREHDLMVIEDCAQAFDGKSWGHPEADVSMFSFGPIKTATALGGALLWLSNKSLLDAMRLRQMTYPVQRRSTYLCRLLKYAALKLFSSQHIFGVIVWLLAQMGCDYDRIVNGLVRGFAGQEFFKRIRQQPSAPLLTVLWRRLQTYDIDRLYQRAAKGRLLLRWLTGRIICPGQTVKQHSFWVFPVLVNDPATVIVLLRGSGFDATQGHSMCTVPPPVGRPDGGAQAASEILARTVYLPIYPEMPDLVMQEMAKVVLSAADTPKIMLRGDLATRITKDEAVSLPSHP
jgi:dTDP-4-amino-4,6-dideoxygalactose transaminase